jgi:hypothetical protein
MSQTEEVADLVRKRAADRCQYCLMHQSLQGATFHIEHVTPRTKGGATNVTNLVLACPSCNLHKADRILATDPESGGSVELFHPLNQTWSEHFVFSAYSIQGLTPVGRATVNALGLNQERRCSIRRAEEKFGLFPPPTSAGHSGQNTARA